ncbi:MAG: DUF4426 domain-containing protein [Moritella sp.]|uniref:DUF4426 domain-containing protein n=1 Tax=unclassified Moritella TaxID=2637987 RepID=UPI000156838B|nr:MULTISPECIES: DUF4426 domain-containing protein [unclassified Moritella]EDM67522.1 hypothetical protein PE36_00814 [Moritella sp. PE36]MBL1416040.1 DUF4426 domain-containing protein [Moritella sp.]PHR87838.1 MAG: DUF4426 domain-containing protein [Moritella sp.]
MPALFKSLLLSIALLVSAAANAEQMQKLGDWDVHYIAFPSTFLTSDIASDYDIDRSKYLGIINISVLDSDTLKAQAVTMTVTARNLLGNIRELDVREIREQNAIYYIAEVPHRNEETYRIKVTISSGNQTQELKFQQKFYVD